ncbi:hypothetical protein FGG08_002158 [Glutinoglossum americanum]|uniref:ADP-ribosylation factor GTPase-activating protein n=1 Tax=Glutinoglossum americanum TaxID=1670608 RepID=A0A9P8L5S7_9PEZI|nr:hypothetical protein FGG08_002158 [Glutinoglossum americanum]
MGNVSSRPDDGAALYLRDQNRLSLASLSITNSRRRTLLNIVPNSFPSTRIIAKRDTGDDGVVEYIQDPDPPVASPGFLLRLNNDDELNFNFTFIIRQNPSQQPNNTAAIGTAVTTGAANNTIINGLTYIFAPNQRDLENLVTREFHANPNLHKNSNVQLVGDFSTEGNNAVQFDWSWKWRPPKAQEDKGGGWRNSCSFVEYDQRAHRLNTLASFSFWVHNAQRAMATIKPVSPRFEMIAPPKLRVPSSQSIDSRVSNPDAQGDTIDPPSPDDTLVENGLGLTQPSTQTAPQINVDISCQRPYDDMAVVEDGPLFRATMKSLEQKTGNMRTKMKKVLKRAEAAQQAQLECNDAVSAFMEALREAASSNANAVKPALEHYFDKIAREILYYEKQNTVNMQKLIIDPLTRLYTIDIKQAEAKKRDFEEESRDYYAYVGRYLGQRQDSLKEKKRVESDSKYQTKRRNFELKRFDYSSFMQDLHGGRKEQEVLSQLTKFAYAQAKTYLGTSVKVQEMMPQLEALNHEVKEADKEYQFQRTEREEKRRALETSNKTYVEPETVQPPLVPPSTSGNNGSSHISDAELSRADSTSSTLRGVAANAPSTTLSPEYGPSAAPASKNQLPSSQGSQALSGSSVSSPGQNKFKGIRDLEEKDYSSIAASDKSAGEQRKEGLLWALSRPGSHLDPKGLNKQAWHKFWVVLDQGKLSEYSNWKQKLDLHMEPIDLRMASVREARNAERRFCFEVITPQYKRVYQATSEDDMKSWITSINNALQSAMEGRGKPSGFNSSAVADGPIRRDIGSVLTGKSQPHGYGGGSYLQGSASSASNSVFRRTTVGARPAYIRNTSSSFEENPERLLQIVREADQGNCWCADCGSGLKAEWVSINLGIVLCIECSGIHRSLGTHISKIRSLTLDTTSFTTDIVELLLQVGNRVSNMIWEARLDAAMRPSPQSTREQRLKFITAKYVERAYVQPISTTLSHYSTPDETLLASIKKNDFQGVLYALALRANPNTADKSRNTHSVFLALAAADPASPQSPVSSPTRPGTPGKVVAFPIAELLVQNGAEIPATMPAFPLSPSAKLYIEQKAGRANTSGDTVGALPVIGPKGELSPVDKQKDREAKLQKRVSAGGRLARAPPLDR